MKYKNFSIYINYNGLGDNLFYSHLPRLAKNNGYERVCVHLPREILNTIKTELIWANNPYVDDIMINTLDKCTSAKMHTGYNLLSSISLNCGFNDVLNITEPEVYYTPSKIFRGDYFDQNFVSGSGLIDSNKISAYLSGREIINVFNTVKTKSLNLNFNSAEVNLLNLYDFFDLVATADDFYCLVSGGASLRAAFGKGAKVFYGPGQKRIHRHSSLNEYIYVGHSSNAAYRYFFGAGYRLLRKLGLNQT